MILLQIILHLKKYARNTFVKLSALVQIYRLYF